MSKSRLNVKSDMTKKIIGQRRPHVLTKFQPSQLCINIANCTGFRRQVETVTYETVAVISSALKEGYIVQFLVAPKDDDAYQKFLIQNNAILAEFAKSKNFQLINKLDHLATEHYKMVDRQFDAYFSSDKNKEKRIKLHALKKQDLDKFAENHKDEVLDENHPITEAKLFISIAKMNKDNGIINTSFWHPKFSLTQGFACDLVDNMTEIGCTKEDILLVSMGKLKDKLYEVVDEKEVFKELKNEIIEGKFTRKDVSVKGCTSSHTFKVSAAVTRLSKKGVKPAWVGKFAYGLLDQLTDDSRGELAEAIVRLYKEGIDPTWAVIFTCAFLDVAEDMEFEYKIVIDEQQAATLTISLPQGKLPVPREIIERKFEDSQDKALFILEALGEVEADIKWTTEFGSLLRKALGSKYNEVLVKCSADSALGEKGNILAVSFPTMLEKNNQHSSSSLSSPNAFFNASPAAKPGSNAGLACNSSSNLSLARSSPY